MNQTKQPVVITLESVLIDPNVKNATPDKRGDAVRAIMANLMKAHGSIQLDLSATNTLTPSFAYQAFGYLYDDFRDEALSHLSFTNDRFQLGTRISNAIQRRKLVVDSQV
jgi:hypothetical protein